MPPRSMEDDMSKGPLFSTYRQGENRVTASVLAVFERVDLSLVERLLGAASGESDLEMVSFRNQVAAPDSIPDASIAAHFRYLFEVKTTGEAVDGRQLRGHLNSLTGHGDERLFVVTPDLDEPDQVRALRTDDEPVSWVGFASLAQAIDEALSEPGGTVSEREAFLLRELVQLFEADGLLRAPEDVVVVAAGRAYGVYQRHGLYTCQAGRSFRGHIARIGFYTAKAIQPEVPTILWRRDAVDISRESSEQLAGSEDLAEREAGKALLAAIESGDLDTGWEGQVFLLSARSDERTLVLARPVAHHGRSGWTQNQRYISSDALRVAATTDDLA